MEVIVRKKYLKDLRKTPSQILAASDKVLAKLKAAENLEESGLDYKKCRGQKDKNYYRIRVGDWRIGVELKNPAVIVITILTRGQMYKRFPPN